MVDILVYNYVKLSELEELLSQPGYMCYGHGTGRKVIEKASLVTKKALIKVLIFLSCFLKHNQKQL